MNLYVVFCLCNITVSYSVLNPSSITSLCKCLSMEEAGLFGLQLGLPLSIKDDLLYAANPAKELAFRLLGIWSGSKHSSRRVRKYVWFWYNLVLISKIIKKIFSRDHYTFILSIMKYFGYGSYCWIHNDFFLNPHTCS